MYIEKWYEKSWVIVLLLIFVFPVGAYLMWTEKYDWEEDKKKKITIIGSIIVVLIIILIVSTGKETEKQPAKVTKNDTTASKVETKKELKVNRFTSDSNSVAIDAPVIFYISADGEGELQYKLFCTKDSKETVVREYATNTDLKWTPTEPGIYSFYVMIKNEDGEAKSSVLSITVISKEEKEAKIAAETDRIEKARVKAEEEVKAKAIADAEKARIKAEDEAKAKAAASIPTEYKTALKKAELYSKSMNMSKRGLYDQLTSEYGEKFTAEAAQYAVDNLQANYKESALKKAQEYQKSMSMSPSAIYDQLISEYGEKFTAEEAQYAIDNLK